MTNIYIIDGARTPIGAYLGQYKKIESVDLGISCVRGLLDRNPKIQKKEIEGLVLGQVLTSGLGMNTARQVALGSGMQQSSFSYVVNQVCGSGMRAAIDGSSKIFSGESDLLLAGGQESMSRARHAYLTRTGENKLGNNVFIDTLINDGLTDAFSKEHMGITAENVSRKYTVKRQEQEHYSYKSYVKTYKALKNKYFISRIFNEKEILKCKKINSSINCYAKRFAAKEAFSKALGTGIANGINFNEIVILNRKSGKPYINIIGQTKKTLNKKFKKKKTKISLSLSDEKKYAVAFVTISI